jgi:PAS domain S-box-containing protein
MTAAIPSQSPVHDALVGVVLDAIQTPVFFKDRAGRFLGCNRAYEEFSGVARAALLGRTVYDLYPREVADRYAAADAALYAHGPSQIYEAPGVRADGEHRDLVVYKAVFRDERGEVTGLVGTMLDVTERRAAERALSTANASLEARVDERTRELARSLQILSATLESTADGILAVDGSGRVLARNGRFADVWGIPSEIASSGDDEQLLAAVSSALKDPEGFRHRVEELYTSHDLEAFDIVELRDGRTFERYSVPMGLGTSRSGRVWSFRDVTERRRAEASRVLLATAVEQATEAILIADANGLVRYANPMCETLAGLARGQLTGVNVRAALAARAPSPVLDGLLAALGLGEPWRGCVAETRADGSLLQIELAVTPVHDDEGKLSSFVAVGHDVTRERQLELEMRHAQKLEAVGRLAGGVAHDFNNLLTVMTTCASLAAETIGEEHPAHAEVLEIQQAVERASRLTHQLLAFSRKQLLLPRILDLNDVVEGLEKMLRRLLGEDVEIVVRTATNLRPIEADPGQIEQIIANLCVNARDAMPRGGRITLGTRQHAATATATTSTGAPAMRARPHAELWIADTGVGMDDATREHLFEPFFTTKERGKGTGLGLSTVYGIVQQSGGEIEVESQVGAGSTFRVFLPSVETKDEVPAAKRRSRGRKRGTEWILLVEDEDAVRRVIARQLELAGYRVVQACDGEEAVEVAMRRETPFDLLVTDLVMPRRSGAEAALAIRAAGKATKVLFISGFSDETNRIPLDATLLPKPFSGEQLLRTVRDVLDDRPLRDG